MPPPKVDSSVIKLNVRKEPPIKLDNEKAFFTLVKAAFAQRRKTLVNTVSNTLGVNKEDLRQALEEIGLSSTVRSEQLTLNELAMLFNKINK